MTETKDSHGFDTYALKPTIRSLLGFKTFGEAMLEFIASLPEKDLELACDYRDRLRDAIIKRDMVLRRERDMAAPETMGQTFNVRISNEKREIVSEENVHFAYGNATQFNSKALAYFQGKCKELGLDPEKHTYSWGTN